MEGGIAQQAIPEIICQTSCQNHPNPFRGETTFSYTLAEADAVTLTLYDALGRKVAVLVEEFQGAGEHRVTFDGTGLAAGVYFYSIETSSKTVQGTMIRQH